MAFAIRETKATQNYIQVFKKFLQGRKPANHLLKFLIYTLQSIVRVVVVMKGLLQSHHPFRLGDYYVIPSGCLSH